MRRQRHRFRPAQRGRRLQAELNELQEEWRARRVILSLLRDIAKNAEQLAEQFARCGLNLRGFTKDEADRLIAIKRRRSGQEQ